MNLSKNPTKSRYLLTYLHFQIFVITTTAFGDVIEIKLQLWITELLESHEIILIPTLGLK